MIAVDVGRLRELAAAATPGPWYDVAGALGNPYDGPDHMRVVGKPHVDARDAVARLEYDKRGGDDAAYIAAVSPDVVTALLDEVDHWRRRALTAEERLDGEAWERLEAERDRLAAVVARVEALADAAAHVETNGGGMVQHETLSHSSGLQCDRCEGYPHRDCVSVLGLRAALAGEGGPR